MRSLNRIAVIAGKELRQVRRDRLTIGMMIMIPIIQLVLFGYAINSDVRHMPTLVVDADRHAESRDLVRRLAATGFYHIAGEAADYAELSTAFRRGHARVGLVIPAGFSAALTARRGAEVQLVVDGSDPQVVASATQSAASVVAAWSAERRQTLQAEPIAMATSVWYNPDQRTAVYIVPGLVGAILTMTLVMFTSIGVTRERERGTLEQLIVSPVKSIELVVGKIIPYIAIGYVQMTLILTVGSRVFGVPIAGSWLTLYGLAALFIAANLSLGLFVSTLAKTQMQAMQMSFFLFLPQMLLSGFMFPFEGMPRVAQWIGSALPLTHFLRIIRGIVLKGAGFTDLHAPVTALAVIAAVLVALSALRFHKKLG